MLSIVTASAGWTVLQVFSSDFVELAVVFFVLALVAALLGLRGVAGISLRIARLFVIVFLILAIVSLLL